MGNYCEIILRHCASEDICWMNRWMNKIRIFCAMKICSRSQRLVTSDSLLFEAWVWLIVWSLWRRKTVFSWLSLYFSAVCRVYQGGPNRQTHRTGLERNAKIFYRLLHRRQFYELFSINLTNCVRRPKMNRQRALDSISRSSWWSTGRFSFNQLPKIVPFPAKTSSFRSERSAEQRSKYIIYYFH